MELERSRELNKKGLGRGIGAIIPGSSLNSAFGGTQANRDSERAYFQCEIERIYPNHYQPRTQFDTNALNELARSVKENGIIQPLIVRKKGDSYELIAGERRWKAAMMAGLTRVPVVIKDISDRQALELALVENIQRDDLTCIEEARAFKQLIDEFNLTQEQVAIKVGKDRATVANTIRLLLLPQDIQKELVEKKLSMGHARALITIQSEAKQVELKDRILKESLSVRETERIAQSLITEKKVKVNDKSDFKFVIEELSKALQAKVDIRGSRKKGNIVIKYFSEEDLNRIFDKVVGNA